MARRVSQGVQRIQLHAIHRLLNGSLSSPESQFPCLQSRNEMRSHLAPKSAGPSVEGSHGARTLQLSPQPPHPGIAPSFPVSLLGALVQCFLRLLLPTVAVPGFGSPALLETTCSKIWKGPSKDSGAIAQMVMRRPEVACWCHPAS